MVETLQREIGDPMMSWKRLFKTHWLRSGVPFEGLR
jgi:hypothetical protein